MDMRTLGGECWATLLLLLTFLTRICRSAEILMITMGGTRSHKIPFLELGKGLTARGHNITFVSPFPPKTLVDGIQEITPPGLVFYVRNYTTWDLLGARMRGEDPLSPYDIFRYGFQVCDAFFGDYETQQLLTNGPNFDLIILDGAFPECALAVVHHYKVPFMYINTVAHYMGSISSAGNPVPWAVTPFFARPFSDNMNLLERVQNAGYFAVLGVMHALSTKLFVQSVVRSHLGPSVPNIMDLASNVSFIIQMGHHSVTYPRPFLPNVMEAGCLHCRPPRPLPKELEEFISARGDRGFIFMSMGSSVRTFNFPECLRVAFIKAFAQLPYQVLWRWEEDEMPDLPRNVKLGRWFPQQDLLGHPKMRAFITHGGLLSMLETVYHGVPIVTMPVFCDHDADAKKAELDGYAVRLELAELTQESLLRSIRTIIHDPRYREKARQRSVFLRDVQNPPLETAVYWTEYVLRHRGAKHLMSPARNLNVFQYYLIDVILVYIFLALASSTILFSSVKLLFRFVRLGSSASDIRLSPKLSRKMKVS